MNATRQSGRPGRPSFLVLPPLVAAGLVFAYPFAWMLCSAFKDNREIFRPLQLLPAAFDSQYFAQLAAGQWLPFGRVFLNSLLVAGAQAALAVVLTSLAGYAFARHEFRGRRWLFLLALVVIVIPQNALAVPLFTWVHALGLGDTLAGVILPGAVSGLGVLYFTQVFRQVPATLVDAARLAGASEFRVYLTLLPLVRPAAISFGLIHFILAWHEHLVPLLVLNSATNQTLPIALAGLYGSSLRFPFAVLMAAGTLAVLPTAVLFAVLHRRLRTALSEMLAQ